MSLDNGTFILKLKRDVITSGNNAHQYFVSTIHAFSNIFKRYSALHDAIKVSAQFDEEKDACQHALEMEKESRTEHGVYFIDTFANKTVLDIDSMRRAQEDEVRHLL